MQLAWTQIDKKLSEVFYAIELTIAVVLTTNILQFGWWRCKAKRGKLTHWQRWEPTYYLAIAVPLQTMMPLAVVLIYIGGVNYPASKMWYGGSWFPNAAHGAILYTLKWIGVACMSVGVIKVTQLHVKIAAKWRELRRGPAKVAKVAGKTDSE